MSPLTWHVDTDPASAHIALHGRPDAASITTLHEVVRGLFKRRPDQLTIDLSAVTPSDRSLVVQSALPVRYSRMARGNAILLCRGHPSEESTTRRERGLPARMSRELARAWHALTLGPLRSPSFSEHLLPTAGAARRTREVVTEACLAWNLPHLARPATLVASELVSHTQRHVSTMMTMVILLHHDVVYLWIRSGRCPQPRPEHAAVSLELMTIDSLASHWGLLPDGDDTLTWAALPT
jgi:hypothetical protein